MVLKLNYSKWNLFEKEGQSRVIVSLIFFFFLYFSSEKV